MCPPAYPEVTVFTPLTRLKMASVHQKQPPPRTRDSKLLDMGALINLE